MNRILQLSWGLVACLGWLKAPAQNYPLIDSLQRVLAHSIADTAKVITLGEIAWEYHIHDQNKALQYAQQELALAQKINFARGIGLGYMDKGVTYSYHREYTKAIDQYLQALPFLKKANRPLLVALVHYNIAVAYSKFEASEKAIRSFLTAVDLLEKQKDWANVSQSYTGIANNYSTLRQFTKALFYHRKAVAVANQHADYEMLAVAQTDLSGTYSALFDASHQKRYLDSALVHLTQVHQLLKKDLVRNPIMRPSVLFNIGNNYFQQGKYEPAIAYVQQALVLAEPIHLQAAICQGNTILGKIYTRQKKFALAQQHLQQALPLALKTSPVYAADTYQALQEWAAAQKNYPAAYNYQKHWAALKDSIYNLEKAAVAEKLGLQYETEKKQARITALEQENQWERQLKVFYLILAGLGLLLSGVLFYLWRLKHKVSRQKENLLQEAREKAMLRQELAEQQREKLQEELRLQAELNALQEMQFQKEIDFKERELTTNVLLLEQQSAFLQKVKVRLATLLPQANGLATELKRVCKLIDTRLGNEQDFEKFMIHFEKVHPDFFSRLDQVALTTLTPADQKLSAYIRINLSTKEMAHLLNVEPKSIQMARYRLKQKLNVPEEVDLISFILQL